MDELKSLESEFIKFLALQGIDALEWEKVKDHDQTRCNYLIEEFSDLVLGSALANIQYLMKDDGHLMFIFDMKEDAAVLNIFEIKGEINSVDDITSDTVVFISTSGKSYIEPRSQEVFKLMESGCSICTADVFGKFKVISGI